MATQGDIEVTVSTLTIYSGGETEPPRSTEQLQDDPETLANIVTAANSANSLFLRLPAELIIEICTFAISTHTPICLRAGRTTAPDGHVSFRFDPILPPLLQTCRQLRAQPIMQLYYSTNHFIIGHTLLRPRAFSAFIAARGPAMIENLTHIRLCHSVRVRRPAPPDPGWGRGTHLDYVFDVAMTSPGHITVATRSITQRHPTTRRDDQICLCTVQYAVVRGRTPLEVVHEYAKLVRARKRIVCHVGVWDLGRCSRHDLFRIV